MTRLEALDWQTAETALDAHGHAVLPRLLAADACDALAAACGDAAMWQKAIALQTIDRGAGDRLPLGAMLPTPLRLLHAALNARLVPIARRWRRVLADTGLSVATTDTDASTGTEPAPASAMRLREGDYLALHHDGIDGHAFPLRIALLLSQPGRDFSGGEFVTIEQRPRLQSRPTVVPLARGDAVVFAAHRRPVTGGAGVYRAGLRRAVSRVRGGERLSIELRFDDAT
ncbi:MAG TPA: 2OG-Fe(II) oxygenase [Mizugakiibacter sp.]